MTFIRSGGFHLKGAIVVINYIKNESIDIGASISNQTPIVRINRDSS